MKLRDDFETLRTLHKEAGLGLQDTRIGRLLDFHDKAVAALERIVTEALDYDDPASSEIAHRVLAELDKELE